MAINTARLTEDGKTLSAWWAFLKEWVQQRGEGAYYWNMDGGNYANTSIYVSSDWRTQNAPNFISSSDSLRQYNIPNCQTNLNWVYATGASSNRAHYWATDCIGILNSWLAFKTDIPAWETGTYNINHGWGDWKITGAVTDNSELYYMGTAITANCQGFCRYFDSLGALHTMEDFPEGTSLPVIVFAGLESRIFNWSERLTDSIGHSGYYVGERGDSWSGARFGFGAKNILESTAINQSSYNYANNQKTWGTVYKRYGVQLCGYNNGTANVNQVCKDGVTRSVKMRRSANGGIWSYWCYNPFVVADPPTPSNNPFILRKKRANVKIFV